MYIMTLSVLFCLCFEINAEKETGKLLLTSMQYFHSTPVDKIVYHIFFLKIFKICGTDAFVVHG